MPELNNSNQFFDQDLTKDCVEAFMSSTGTSCFITDSGGQPILGTNKECGYCNLCENLQKFQPDYVSCSGAHLYGLIQSERFGGKYIYFCPVGLTFFISPIMGEFGSVAALTGGPVLMIDPEEFIQYDLLDRLKIDISHEEELRHIIENIPVKQPDVVTKLSTMLFVTAGFLSSVNQSNKMINEYETTLQQGYISEYIHTMKKGDLTELPPYPFEKEKELLASIGEGDRSLSQKLLNELLGHIFFLSGGNLDVIKARVLELIALLSRAAVDGGAEAEQIFGLNYRYINEINRFKTIDELCYWLAGIMSRFTDFVFRYNDIKHIDVIHKAIDYIRRNYMKKISLEEVAENIYLSPSYFSKIFKEEMNCNFNSYLNKLRIEKSKSLLLSDNISLIEIAGLLGFEDQSYFSKVFKKVTGVTPGKFRESRGQIRSTVKKEPT